LRRHEWSLAWNVRGYDRGEASLLEASGYNPLVAALLASRGCGSPEKAADFLRDDLGILSDPFLLIDMDKAVARIRKAVASNEHVAVFGDYDVDGITSSCIVSRWFRSQGLRCETYIPERLTEGYGLSEEALRQLAEKGCTLVVTVDCGVTAPEQVKFGYSLGMDFVITDHHKCMDTLPRAEAVVDPHRHDCPYPFKGLAGVGVAFKLICALEGSDKFEEVMEQYGELAAIGTVADIMPVTGENRAIIKRGISVSRSGKGSIGLRALMNEIHLQPALLTDLDLSFSIVPRLNAAGRMGHVSLAYDLLMADDSESAGTLASKLCALNTARREVENRIYKEALEMLPENVDTPIVLADPGWHQGVSGIVASRLAERFGVPAVVISIENGEGRGSCRSCYGFSIYNALDSLKSLLGSYGGHALAAGMTLPEENIDSFRAALTEYYNALRSEGAQAELHIDFEADDLSLMTLENFEALTLTAPWGYGNPPARICVKNAVVEQIFSIGGDKHLKMRIKKGSSTADCIYFSMTVKELGLQPGSLCSLAFEPNINDFRGVRSAQLLVKDVIPSPVPVERDFDLCRLVVSGRADALSDEEKAHLLPDRIELAAVWRALVSKRGALSGQHAHVMSSLCAAAGIGRPGCVNVCICVLEELGLIKVKRDYNGHMDISVSESPAKKDLNNSGILRALKG